MYCDNGNGSDDEKVIPSQVVKHRPKDTPRRIFEREKEEKREKERERKKE